MTDLQPFLVSPGERVIDLVAKIDRNAQGIALVVDDRKLVGTVTDGDVRRALLSRQDLDEDVQELLERKWRDYPETRVPVTAPVGTSTTELISLMNERRIRHVPLVDKDGRVADLALLSELVREYELPLTAVVMAGGFGHRLRPLTEDLPKPMLPVGGRPVLEHIIDQLRTAGIKRVNLTTHFKGDVISEHFGTGSKHGVDIAYVQEDEPLGTAGALGLLEEADGPLLVMNGDILTRIDFVAMHAFHTEHQAAMTVAVKDHDLEVPYGVVDTDGLVIRAIHEKPRIRHFINAGIYILDPEVRSHIEPRTPVDMPHLVAKLVADGARVVSFPVHEYWLDIGHAATYEQAERDHGSGKLAT